MKQNGARQLPIQDFLTANGKTLRGFAAEAGMPLATASDLVKGKREPRTSNVNKVLAWARTLDPSVTYEQLFAPEQNALAQGPGGSSPGPAGATGYASG